jgi:hypothetical protein
VARSSKPVQPRFAPFGGRTYEVKASLGRVARGEADAYRAVMSRFLFVSREGGGACSRLVRTRTGGPGIDGEARSADKELFRIAEKAARP